MFYKILIFIVKFFLYLFNNKIIIENKNNFLKNKKNCVLVAPHTCWIESLYFAISCYPKKISFIIKNELLKNIFLKFFFNKLNMIAVERNKPKLIIFKKAINLLKNTNYNLLIYPSGSRYLKKNKNGCFLISKMANVKIFPIIYIGPKKIREIFFYKKIIIRFGKSLNIKKNEKNIKLNFLLEKIFLKLYKK